MSSIMLKGETLGKRQQHYNKLVKESIANCNQSMELTKINIEESDIDNLVKIDIASSNKNVEYILEVLKYEDMLYVSRAIKKSTWLICDNQYTYIINPEYLYSQLFPQMMSKAINKFLLHIRQNLKDEKRVEEFFTHQINNNSITSALKWLPHCSLSFIEKIVEKNSNHINVSLLKRLCEKSISVLEIFTRKYSYYLRNAFEVTMFLLYRHTEKYLDIIESVEKYQMPTFGKKTTKYMMTICPQRILKKFKIYATNIHIPTFAKYLKIDIKEFLIKQLAKEEMKDWFQFDRLKHFVKYIPKEGRFEFLKHLFIDKKYIYKEKEYHDNYLYYFSNSAIESNIKSANIYRWYRFAPFNVAFTELKKLLWAESSPDERNEILAILLICANRNLQHIQVLLQYYHDKHINESYKFKSQFINKLFLHSNTHEYCEKTWTILNTLFLSMEVYTESDNNVQSCIEAIIIYKVLHNESIPEIIEKQFVFHSLQKYQTKLNDEQKNQLFKYLYTYLQSKMKSKDIVNCITEFKDSSRLLENALTLLVDWKKELCDYPWILEIIKEHIKIKKEKSWDVDLTFIYNIKKSWRKHMFEVSLYLNPSEEVCLNALKHDPKILTQYKKEVDALCCDDSVSMRRLLDKLRIYWSQSLAVEWINAYSERLEQPSGHSALIRGLCALLKQNDLLIIIKKYEPEDPKINWNEANTLILSLRKQIAKNMYSARPQPTPDSILSYAKGDYLQYALPSLSAIFYNLSIFKSREYIQKLLDAPVSIQKHGIRLGLTKLNSDELIHVFSKLWVSTNNSSIRTVLFKSTYELLCKEKNTAMIEEIYQLLDTFVDNLTSDENKLIYYILGKFDKVPLHVRGKYCMKSYIFLKSLPAKADCDNIVNQVISKAKNVVEYLRPDFVTDLLIEFIENKYAKKRIAYKEPIMYLMSSYLLCSKNETEQIHKYEQVLVPLMEKTFALWDTEKDEMYFIRENFNDLLYYILKDYKKAFLEKNIIAPIKILANMQTELENTLSIKKNYVTLRTWKLAVAFVKLLDKNKPLTPENEPSTDTKDESKQNLVCLKAAAEFGKICQQYLKDDVKIYFPSIYVLFSKAMDAVFMELDLNRSTELEICKSIVECEHFIQSKLLVLQMLPNSVDKEDEAIMEEIRKLILSHSSEEVQMHGYQVFQDNSSIKQI